MKIILVRHATTEWNNGHRLQGQTDIPLSEQGKIEAKQLAGVLRELKIGKIISSDLKRALETARIINVRLGAELITDKRLRECNFGSLEGLPKDEAAKVLGREDWDSEYKNYDYHPYGGENCEEVLARHLEVINEHRSARESVLLVGHGRGLNTLLAGLGHEPNLRRGEYRVLGV